MGRSFDDVGGGVADGDLAVAFSVAVGLHVADGSFYEGGRLGLFARRDDLVADVECHEVVVSDKGVHDGRVHFKLCGVPVGVDLALLVGSGRQRMSRLTGLIKVGKVSMSRVTYIPAFIERFHAAIIIGVRVERGIRGWR